MDIDVLTTPELSFFYHMYGEDMGTLNVDITQDNGLNWTNIWSQTGAVQSANTDPWLEAVIDLTTYSGLIQIRFQGIAGPSFNSDMAIDDVAVREASGCAPVTGVSFSNITPTTAQVDWLDHVSRLNTDIELVNITDNGVFTGTPNHPGIIGTSYTFTGLDEATEYDVYLRGNCSGGSSTWTGPFGFITSCTSYEGNTFSNPIMVSILPYADTNNTAIPCITNDYTGQGSNDLIYQLTTGGSTDSLIISTCNGVSNFDTYLYLLDSLQNVVAFNDDDPTGTCGFLLGGQNRFSILQADVNPNTTYYVVVDGWSTSSEGNYAVTIDEVAPCPSSLAVDGTPASGAYSSSGLLTSTATIVNPNIVVFRGGIGPGHGVELQGGFEVQLGAEFEANNDGCP